MLSNHWSVEHLASAEPEAAPYLAWDDSTMTSRGESILELPPILLQNCGIPSELIISVERRLSFPARYVRKFWKFVRLFLRYAKRKMASSHSLASTTDQSLGEMGVLV
jgi:hypothetical protein